MKKLIILLLITLSVFKTSTAQFNISLQGGMSVVPVTKIDFNYKLKNHSLIFESIGFVSKKSSLPTAIVSINYGYNINSWQPYVGYSSNGLSYGINKWFDDILISYTRSGKYNSITFGVSSLTYKNKYPGLFTNNDGLIVALQFISGFSNGMHEAIQAGHWGSGQFWDNKVSWKNKYKDFDAGDTRAAFIGSKSVFVSVTDGYHLTNLISNTANIATFTVALTGKEKMNWKIIAKKVLISVAANRAAYYISYNHVFAKK